MTARAAAGWTAAMGFAAIGLIAAACAPRQELGGPLSGLTREQRALRGPGARSSRGCSRPETGLGPLFNADSCAECHEDAGGRRTW